MEITLERMFYDYVQADDYVESEEHRNAIKAVDNFLDNQIILERNLKSDLRDLIGNSQFISQEQGFINGFKYAMSLIKECGLK